MAPAFGFSVGDVIAGTKFLIEVFCAFREAEGAVSKYAAEVAGTLERLEAYVGELHLDNDTDDLVRVLKTVKDPLSDFETFLKHYETSLGKAPVTLSLAKASKTIGFTVKGLGGKVEKLRRQILQPLQLINSLFALKALKDIEAKKDEPLNSAQCAQIVEAINSADITQSLDQQIRALKQTADAHNIKNDEHLRQIQQLRSDLGYDLAGIRAVLIDMRGATTTASTDEGDGPVGAVGLPITGRYSSLPEALEERMVTIEGALKEQTQLTLALRSFLEDKIVLQKAALAPASDTCEEPSEQNGHNSWPSSTLPAAHLAVSLLSAIITSVATTAISRKSQTFKKKDTFKAPVDARQTDTGCSRTFADPRLTTNESVSETAVKDEPVMNAQSKNSPAKRSSIWVSQFRWSLGAVRSGPFEQEISTGWSQKLSKLDAGSSGGNDEAGSSTGNDFMNIPSSADLNFEGVEMGGSISDDGDDTIISGDEDDDDDSDDSGGHSAGDSDSS